MRDFENSIQYQFKNKALLKTALTHSSYVYENNQSRLSSNERLEFLGDAVLELVISRYLYDAFPQLSEGELTKYRAGIVCEASLAKEAAVLGIGEKLLLGKGEELTGGRTRSSTISDAFEALIGAVYLDGDLEEAQNFIIRILSREIDNLNESFLMSDCKTYLQELLQKNNGGPVVYEIINMVGPAHDKEFTAIVKHKGQILGKGVGKTKKEAEQNAAHNAINSL